MKRPYHWLRRNFLGLDPDEPANDGSTGLFIGTTLLQVLLAVFAVLALFPGKEFVTQVGLGFSFLLYEGMLTLFGVYAAKFQPKQRERAGRENGRTSPGERTKRAGEKIGAAFVVFVAVLIPLLAAVLEALGFHTEANEVPLWAAVTTIVVMSETSIYKSKRENRKQVQIRGIHNKLLFDLSVLTQATIIVLIVMRSIWETALPLHIFFVLVAALGSYARHNWELNKRCPDVSRRGWGHVMVWLVMGFTVAIIFLTTTPGLQTYLPWLAIFTMLPVLEVTLLFGITIGVLFVSTALQLQDSNAKRNGNN